MNLHYVGFKCAAQIRAVVRRFERDALVATPCGPSEDGADVAARFTLEIFAFKIVRGALDVDRIRVNQRGRRLDRCFLALDFLKHGHNGPRDFLRASQRV